MEGVGNVEEHGLIAYAGELDLVTFEHYDGEYPLIAGIGALVTSFYYDAHGGNAFQAVCRHDDTIKLDYGILELVELGMHCKRCGK
jgi:hypothetical protein